MNCNEVSGFTYFVSKAQPKSQYGKLGLKNLVQLNSAAEITSEQKLLIEVIELNAKTKSNIKDILVHFKNIKFVLDKISKCQSVDVVDLFEVKMQALKTIELAKELDKMSFKLNDVSEIIKVLDPTTEGSYTFTLFGKYDSEYDDIINRKKLLEREINMSFKNVSKLKNEREQLILEEHQKAEEIIKKIVNELSSNIHLMIENIEIITSIDIKLAFANVYKDYSYTVTNFSEDILIEDAVIPLISDNVKNFTALTIDLRRGSTLIIGANMGGKSTILKNVALQSLLTSYGLLPLATKFQMPYLKNIVFLTSYEDTSHGLSRFGNEIKMLSKYLEELDDNTLFLVDEFASSTNPSEGYLFVKSLINYCNSLNSFSVFTSHYDNLSKECMTYQVVGLKESENNNLSLNDLMDYTIVKSNDICVPKQALFVAKHLGINKDLLQVLEKSYKERE